MTSDSTPPHRQVNQNRITRYDILLLAIPAAFLLSLGLGSLLGWSFHAAIGTASLLAAFAVGDGLFRNPPQHPPTADDPDYST